MVFLHFILKTFADELTPARMDISRGISLHTSFQLFKKKKDIIIPVQVPKCIMTVALNLKCDAVFGVDHGVEA